VVAGCISLLFYKQESGVVKPRILEQKAYCSQRKLKLYLELE